MADLLAALEALDTDLDTDAIEAMAALFGPDAEQSRRAQLLRAITEDPNGRSIVRNALADRLPERLADARSAVVDYERLLAEPATSETDMQRFIEENVWLLGLDYAAMRPRQDIAGGTVDFFLQRFDGFHDLLELKSPQDPIVSVPEPTNGRAPAPSAHSLSSVLGQALAQVHVYRDRLTRFAEAQEGLLGLSNTRDPRLVIVIGRSAALSEHAKPVLTELNKSLHGVEVVPYDILAERAKAILSNVERYQLAAQEALDGGPA